MRLCPYTLPLGALLLSGCIDAVIGEAAACKLGNQRYAADEQFETASGCSCWCTGDGSVECVATCDSSVPAADGEVALGTDGGALPWHFDAAWPPSGAGFTWECDKAVQGARHVPDPCRTCFCDDDGCRFESDLSCPFHGAVFDGGVFDAEAHNASASFWAEPRGGPHCAGGTCDIYCVANGAQYAQYETFGGKDDCDICVCTRAGVSCKPSGCNSTCWMGKRAYAEGARVVCDDGCNDCTCTPTGWSGFAASCAALHTVEECLPNPAPLRNVRFLYLAGDALAVEIETQGCAGLPPYRLCVDSSATESEKRVRLGLALADPGCPQFTRQQVVFDLSPLRTAYQAAIAGQGMIDISFESIRVNYSF